MKKCAISMKKIVSAMAAVLIFMLSVCSYSMNTGAANTSNTYRVFSASTGNYLRSYTLDPIPSANNSRKIIGIDEREIDWSKSGVVKIMTEGDYIGTGFVIDDHTIATAAHCVYEQHYICGIELSEILLFDVNGNVTLHATPVEEHIPLGYINANPLYSERSATQDYALITVEEDLSDYICFSLGVPLDSVKDNNTVVSVTGFPYEIDGVDEPVNTYSRHEMYTGSGIIVDAPTDHLDQLYYSNDTSSGNSGSPVYVTESRGGRTYYTVIAINVGYTNLPLYQYNIGMRMTTDLINFYNANDNLNW